MDIDIGRALLLKNIFKNDFSDSEIESINEYMNNFLEEILENANRALTEEDKRMIENYFSHFSDVSFSNLEKYTQAQDVVKRLQDIQYYKLAGRSEDTQFLTKFLDKGYLSSFVNDCAFRILEECENGNIDNIGQLENIASLITGFEPNDEPMQRILDVLENNGIDRNHNKVIEAQFERWYYFFKYDPDDTFENIEKRSITWISEYFTNITSAKDFNIFNEQWLCNFIQLKINGQLSQEFSDMLSKYMQEEKDISKNKNAVSKFMVEYKDRTVVSVQDFDEFVRNLGEIKLCTGVIPRDAVNFIIKQTLDKKSVISANTEKYLGLVERTVEDFASWDLPGRVKTKHNYSYFLKDKIEGNSRTLGICYQTLHICELNEDAVNRLLQDKDIGILDTIFHENTHAEQSYDKNEGTFQNFRRYMILKENILKSEYEGYYQANYRLNYEEIEARSEAACKLQRFIDESGINVNDIVFSKGNQQIYKGIELSEELKKRIDEESINSIFGQKKKQKINDEKNSIYEIFDELVARRPELIQQYPILTMEYNTDGTKKELSELLLLTTISRDNAQGNMIKNMFCKGNIFKRKNLIKDMKALAAFDCKGNEGAEYAIAIIVSEVYENFFIEMKAESKDMSSEDLQKVALELNEIENIIRKNIDSKAFIRGLSHSRKMDKKHKSPMKHFMDMRNLLNLRLIDCDVPTLSKKDLDYDTEIQEQFQLSLRKAKQTVDIELDALKRNDDDSIEIANNIYGKVLGNFSLHPWGQSFEKELEKYRQERFKDTNVSQLDRWTGRFKKWNEASSNIAPGERHKIANGIMTSIKEYATNEKSDIDAQKGEEK